MAQKIPLSLMAQIYQKSMHLKSMLIDSNGAGDIFAGAALHKVIEGENFAEACRFGNFASSRIVQEKKSTPHYKRIQRPPSKF